MFKNEDNCGLPDPCLSSEPVDSCLGNSIIPDMQTVSWLVRLLMSAYFVHTYFKYEVTITADHPQRFFFGSLASITCLSFSCKPPLKILYLHFAFKTWAMLNQIRHNAARLLLRIHVRQKEHKFPVFHWGLMKKYRTEKKRNMQAEIIDSIKAVALKYVDFEPGPGYSSKHRNFATFGATRGLFFYANLWSHGSKSVQDVSRLLLSFQSQRFLQVAFYSLKVERTFVLIGRIVTLS